MRPAVLPLLLLLAVPGAAAAAEAVPALERPPGGNWLVLARLPPLLAREEVRKHLETGLTTTFAFHAHARGAGAGEAAEGAARVDVRYEPWDEVYWVTRADVSGKVSRLTFPSFERLARWWQELRLEIIKPPRPGAGRVEVRLRVIPFSHSEQLDAQRWFSQALAEEEPGGAGSVSQVTEDQPETFRDLLNLLMATSIRRPALLEYEWTLAVPREGKR